MISAPQRPGPAIALVDDERFDLHVPLDTRHPERPERLAAARSGLFGCLGRERFTHLAPRQASAAEIAAVHPAAYTAALRARLAEGSGLLEADTYFSSGTEEATWLAAGGAADLGRALASGTRQGIALVRPPGHHAEPEAAMGFCLLNNVAIAATAALAAGAERVSIVDWDVHHGNGTQAAFYGDPRVLFISLHQYPFYPGTGAPTEIGAGQGLGKTANVALPSGAGPEAYGDAFRRVVLPLVRAHGADVLLVSAGFDAHARDPLAGMELDAETYGAMASALLDLAEAGPHGAVGFLLEGGYSLRALEASIGAVGKALQGERTALPEGVAAAEHRRAVDATLAALRPHWDALA